MRVVKFDPGCGNNKSFKSVVSDVILNRFCLVKLYPIPGLNLDKHFWLKELGL